MLRNENHRCYDHGKGIFCVSAATSLVDCALKDISGAQTSQCLPGTTSISSTPFLHPSPTSNSPSNPANSVEPSSEQSRSLPPVVVCSSTPSSNVVATFTDTSSSIAPSLSSQDTADTSNEAPETVLSLAITSFYPSPPLPFTTSSIDLDSVSISNYQTSTSPVPPVTQFAITASSKDHIGAIVGGVIGVLAFFALLVVLYLLRKPFVARLRRNRTAPSAEFMSHPALFPSRGLSSGTRDSTPPLLRSTSPFQYTYADEESPPQEPLPLFTQGRYTDPVIEKVNAAAAAAAAAARREMHEAHVSGNRFAKSTNDEWVVT